MMKLQLSIQRNYKIYNVCTKYFEKIFYKSVVNIHESLWKMGFWPRMCNQT